MWARHGRLRPTSPSSTLNIPHPKIFRPVLLSLVTIAVGLAAISHQSFWMDEGGTIFRAMMPTVDQWWAMMLQLRGSDVLMPVYMFYAWFWHQVIGATSEYALRMSNLPWFVLTVVVLARVRFWPLVCLLSPFVLYFVNDFRPYSMQIAAGACAAAALGRWMEGSSHPGFRGVHAVCASCLFLIVCSLTGAVWAAGVAIGAVLSRPECLRRMDFWWRALPWLMVSLAAGGYYAFMMFKGYRAVGIQDAGILNVLFGVYEMTGLLGLGPGKNELRRSLASVIPHLWLLVPAALSIGAAWLCGLTSWARSGRRQALIGGVAAVLVPLLLLSVIGIVMEFRVVGRHLSPAIPAILLPLAACLRAEGPRRKITLALGGAACFFMALSAFNVRFHERHANDDYRKATGIVIEALKEGKKVWWQADMNATRYYAYRAGGMDTINAIQVLESDVPSSLITTDLVIINRPDLKHRGFDYQSELRRNFFKLEQVFTGFEIWKSE
jgi:hypothetical protein